MRGMLKSVIFYCVIMFCVIALAAAVEHYLEPSELTGTPAVAARVLPAVVHVESPNVCQGSGCLISEDGIMFTAKHVTDGLHNDYKVTLNDGRRFDVKYIIEDEENDLAFMQLDLPDGVKVPYAKLGKSSDLQVGEDILIIGSSLGMDNFNTVSKGIVSYMGRDMDLPAIYAAYNWNNMVQSTSPSFPGNSGGPAFNMQGQVVGVLVAGADATLNYSVPVNHFREDVDTIRTALALSRFMEVEPRVETEPDNGYYDYCEVQEVFNDG